METYNCYYEADEGEKLNISQIFYMVKNYQLIEITLDNGYYIRQWKDIDLTYEDEDNGKFDMKYGMLYCTAGNNIESIWHGRGEDDLKAWIGTCENYI